MTRGEFLTGLGAMALAGTAAGEETGRPKGGIRLLFTGTGGADWGAPPKGGGEYRANAGALLNGRVLIDLTSTSARNILRDAQPEAIFYTHSHPDHYMPKALAELPSVRRVYVHESWAGGARYELGHAGVKATVTPVAFGKTYDECGLTFMPLAANHSARAGECCAIYSVRAAGTHLLYATDTGGLTGEAFRCLDVPVTAIVMNAMIGVGQRTNRRIFNHSTPELVAETAAALKAAGKYAPPAGRPVWTTHLSKELNGNHAEVAAGYPKGLVPAHDGLTIEI